jgi:cyclin B
VGITSLWMACKYEETYQVPSIEGCVQLCNFAFSKQDILATEAQIVCLLDFKFPGTTEFHYFNLLARVGGFPPRDCSLGRYILEMCLFALHFKKFSSKLMACGVSYFVRKLRKREGACSK